jgi:DNA-binding NarL/FixJ family response regulator
MPIKVFLADDHTVIREGLCSLLKKQNDITVIGDAGDGYQAVDQVQKLRPDVVIMDIAMPKLNGIEATHQIRKSCPKTQVVILSMYSSTEHIFQSLKAGARGYLLKESAGMELVAAVRAAYAGRRYLSQKIEETMIDNYVHQRELTEAKSPLARLSPREREVLKIVVEGKSSKEIANTLYLSPKSVETYRSRIMHKLSLSDLPNLVKFAIQHGLTPPLPPNIA